MGLKIGDADLDGFPDLLPIIAHNGEVYGVATTPWLLRSVPCNVNYDKNLGGCPTGRRAFDPVSKEVGVLQAISDARGVAFLDMDEDVSCRISVHIIY
jgi:integrin alpha FG-GAP repeat containing protein 1